MSFIVVMPGEFDYYYERHSKILVSPSGTIKCYDRRPRKAVGSETYDEKGRLVKGDITVILNSVAFRAVGF